MFTFKKVFAKYYDRWYKDSLESAKYCREHGLGELKAQEYEKSAEGYRILIEQNRKAIDFFKLDDNAFTIDRFLPKEFQGYE